MNSFAFLAFYLSTSPQSSLALFLTFSSLSPFSPSTPPLSLVVSSLVWIAGWNCHRSIASFAKK